MTSKLGVCGLLLTASCAVASAEPSIHGLGTLPGFESSTATGVSARGREVSVTLGGPAGARAARWTPAGGLVDLGTLGGFQNAVATAISGDGRVIVGWCQSDNGQILAFKATETGGIVVLGGTPPELSSTANSVNFDGTVITGSGYPLGIESVRGIRWSASGSQALSSAGTFPDCAAGWVSADGEVLVGDSTTTAPSPLFYTHVPTRWNGGGGATNLGLPAGAFRGYCTALSSNGVTVFGTYESTSFDGDRIFKWTAANGMEPIAAPPDTLYQHVNAANWDGTVYAGYVDPVFDETYAFMVTPELGLVDLNDYLPSLGIDLTGWRLVSVNSISPDGMHIAGEGEHDGVGEGWVVDLSVDSDGDGLTDDWETKGIPYYDEFGAMQRYVLDLDGDGVSDADPRRKDLFVEVDAMTGQHFSFASIGRVTEAFNNAPLTNPDGSTGISIHIVSDEQDLTLLPDWHCSDPHNCLPDTFDAVEEQHFGTLEERSSADHAPLLGAKRLAYRHCIVAFTSSQDTGGCGYTGGDSFVVFAGTVRSSNAGEDKAAVFMHELGHNLGLSHGGGDAVNGKPNYPSIMNYVLSYRYQWCDTFWKLDFSRADAATFNHLDEAALLETHGVHSAHNEYAAYSMPFGYDVVNAGTFTRELGWVRLDGSAVDFSCAPGGSYNYVLDGLYTDTVQQDLNWLDHPPSGILLPVTSSAGQVMVPFDDWGHVVLALKAARNDTSPATTATDELTATARDYIDSQWPLPPGVCAADIGSQGGVAGRDGALNNNDFVVYIDWFFGGDPRADRGQVGGIPGRDGLFDNNDFIVFIDQFFAGC